MRECRIKVYGQFLEAYKSVMVGTMAAAFAVSTEFLDAELSRFIAAGKLNAKIDKVRRDLHFSLFFFLRAEVCARGDVCPVTLLLFCSFHSFVVCTIHVAFVGASP